MRLIFIFWNYWKNINRKQYWNKIKKILAIYESMVNKNTNFIINNNFNNLNLNGPKVDGIWVNILGSKIGSSVGKDMHGPKIGGVGVSIIGPKKARIGVDMHGPKISDSVEIEMHGPKIGGNNNFNNQNSIIKYGYQNNNNFNNNFGN